MRWVTTALVLVALTGVCVFSKKELDPSEILLNSLPPKQVSCILLRKHLSIANRTKCTKLERNLKYISSFNSNNAYMFYNHGDVFCNNNLS